MRPLVSGTILVAVFAAITSRAAAQWSFAMPSFDCGETSTPVENIICSDPALAELDRLLG
jgi:uncharacterized protein